MFGVFRKVAFGSMLSRMYVPMWCAKSVLITLIITMGSSKAIYQSILSLSLFILFFIYNLSYCPY